MVHRFVVWVHPSALKILCTPVDSNPFLGVQSAISKGAVVRYGLQRLSLFPACVSELGWWAPCFLTA